MVVGIAELVVDHHQPLGVVADRVFPGHRDAAMHLDRLFRDLPGDATRQVLGLACFLPWSGVPHGCGGGDDDGPRPVRSRSTGPRCGAAGPGKLPMGLPNWVRVPR
jgi:hypothetical protein